MRISRQKQLIGRALGIVRPVLIEKVERDHRQSDKAYRRRRIVVAITLAAFPLATATIVSVLAAAGYGFAAWRIGRRVASGHLQGRMPELLDAVSPRQAA